MSRLTCHGLARRPWFEGLDLELMPGETCVLTGPTGAGKSLLLRAIADLDPLDAGSLSLDGREREAFAPHEWRRRVVYTHPGGVRLPGTVAQNLERVAELASVREGSRNATPLEHPLEGGADAERLSSGEGNWLALARAASVGPEVLLLDEPTAALDPASAARAEAWIRAFADGGRAVLWISHDPALANRLGARHLTWETLTA